MGHMILFYDIHMTNYRCSGQVPSRHDKEELKLAGLGEERVNIGLKASAAQLHQKLLNVYPKLEQAGGYELMRCLPNSRSLSSVTRNGLYERGHDKDFLFNEYTALVCGVP